MRAYTMKVKVNDIKVNSGRREVSPEYVVEPEKSITAVGLLNPATLIGDYTLVAAPSGGCKAVGLDGNISIPTDYLLGL